MAVDVGGEAALRVVEVQGGEQVAADLGVEAVEDIAERLAGAHVIAGRVEMAGVEADAEPRAAAGRVEQLGQLAERAPQRAARAGGVLEVQRAALGFVERLPDDLARALDRRGDLA